MVKRGKKNMLYYHMTSIENIDSIARLGLIPLNGDNGKLIGETKKKVYFSEGFEGTIALFVDFNIVFEKVKNGLSKIIDKQIENRVLESQNIREYLGPGVYLCFEGTGINNERNFENGCTNEIVMPDKLFVCALKKGKSSKLIFSRFEVIHYMMAHTRPEDINYYGIEYENSPRFVEATKNIQNKVKIYYDKNKSEISKYANNYAIQLISLSDFVGNFEKI